jgi:hypothetical protein
MSCYGSGQSGYDVVTRLKQSSYLTCRAAYQGEYLPALSVGANSVSIVIAVFGVSSSIPIASFGYNGPSTWLGGEVRQSLHVGEYISP